VGLAVPSSAAQARKLNSLRENTDKAGEAPPTSRMLAAGLALEQKRPRQPGRAIAIWKW
jgi:hypothetical protein